MHDITRWGISRPRTVSDSGTTSGATDLLYWLARAALRTSPTTSPTRSHHWRTLYTLVYPDYRGSGRSEFAPRATYRFERIADDADELRVYALRHPEACVGMVLVCTTPTGNPQKIAVPALRALGPTRTAKVLALAAWYVAAWSWRSDSKDKQAARYAAMAVTQEGIPAVRDKVMATMAGLPAPNDNVPQLEREFARTDLTGRLHEIRCPTLVLYGERDAMMVTGGQMLMQGLSGARRVCIRDVGHEPFIEGPDDAFPAVHESTAGGETAVACQTRTRVRTIEVTRSAKASGRTRNGL